jgi:hypothetical protein
MPLPWDSPTIFFGSCKPLFSLDFHMRAMGEFDLGAPLA